MRVILNYYLLEKYLGVIMVFTILARLAAVRSGRSVKRHVSVHSLVTLLVSLTECTITLFDHLLKWYSDLKL